MMLRFHTQTAGSTLTAQQPDVNVVRVALQALAAVLGGTQSLHTNSRDEALALPTEESARLALRTQQIIAYETGVTSVADPLGGSEYIEKLTDEIERGARSLHRAHRRDGRHAARHRRRVHPARNSERGLRIPAVVEPGETIVVGVNRFEETASAPPPVFRVDPAIDNGKSSASARCGPPATHSAQARVSMNWSQPRAATRI